MLVLLNGDDFNTVYQLEQDSHTHPWSYQNLADCFANKQHLIMGYKLKQELIGYCILQKLQVEIDILNFIIDSKYQHQGFGYRFLQVIIHHAFEKGGLEVFLEVRRSNAIAQALYEKSGFKQIGVRKNYYPLQAAYEDAILYCLQLKD